MVVYQVVIAGISGSGLRSGWPAIRGWYPVAIWLPTLRHAHFAILIQFCYQAFAAVDIVGGLAVYGFADTPAKRVVLVTGYFSAVVFFCRQLTIGGVNQAGLV